MTAYVLAAALAAAGLFAAHVLEHQLELAPVAPCPPHVNAYGEVVYA